MKSVLGGYDLVERVRWAEPLAKKLLDTSRPYFDGKTPVFNMALAHAAALIAVCKTNPDPKRQCDPIEIVRLLRYVMEQGIIPPEMTATLLPPKAKG